MEVVSLSELAKASAGGGGENEWLACLPPPASFARYRPGFWLCICDMRVRCLGRPSKTYQPH